MQQAVARRLDDAAALARDERRRRLALLADRPRRPRLVLAHEARVADDVGGEDRGKLPGFRHGVVSESQKPIMNDASGRLRGARRHATPCEAKNCPEDRDGPSSKKRYAARGQ